MMAEQAEIDRQKRVANQGVIIDHSDLGNLDKFTERDLKKWIHNNLEIDACETKEDYMVFIKENHTFISPAPRARNTRLCPKTHQFQSRLSF